MDNFDISGYHYDAKASRLFIKLPDNKEKQLISINKINTQLEK